MSNSKRFQSIRLSLLSLAVLGAFPVVAEAAVAGRFQFVAGDVRIVALDGNRRIAHKGLEVNEGETVLTAANSSAQLKMIDGGVLALRPGTQLKVVTYAFNGAEDGSENAALSLVKGGLRAITGLIGNTNKDKYKFQTPTAVIGIRGTDHEPVVILAPEPGATAENPPGTYDKVNVGATSMTTEAGTAFIGPNQVGFAASLSQLPVLLPKLPNFYQATPAPPAKTDKGQQKQAAAGAPVPLKAGQSDSGDSPDANTPSGPLRAAAAASEPLRAAIASSEPLKALATNLTGTDASGNVLNLAKQTLTASSGQTQSLTAETLARLKNDGPELIATYPMLEASGNAVFPSIFFLGGTDLALTRDAGGHLTGASDSGKTDSKFGRGSGFRGALSQNGSSLTDFGGSIDSGLTWGRWQGGQVTQSSQFFGQDANGNWGLGAPDAGGEFVIGATQSRSTALGDASLHWLAGTSAAPRYLTRTLTGIAGYTLLGGTHPTDQLGRTGTLNSASLGVNFTTQEAKANVNFSLGGNNWEMQSGAMRLDGPHFSSFVACNPECSSGVGLSKNGIATSSIPAPNTAFSFGNMSGMLMGQGLTGAGLQYAVQEMVPGTGVDPVSGRPIVTFSTSLIQGVAGFSGPLQNVDTPFRMVGITDGWGFILDESSFSGNLTLSPGGLYRGSVLGQEQPVARVVDSPAGLTEFIGQAHGYTPLAVTVPAPGLYDRALDDTIRIGSAVNRDTGSATIGGNTISWGRWEGGSIDIYSRDGSEKLGSIDNTNRSMHWLASSALNASTFGLPLSGVANYTVAGHTSPTDFNGNVGTLGAVTLKADFTNAKIDAGINVSFNSAANTSNWNMTASNIPIGGREGFSSNTTLNGAGGIVHNASCSGASCGAQTMGYINGHFFSGAQGAAMTYGMATGSSATGAAGSTFTPINGVTGLVVMKR